MSFEIEFLNVFWSWKLKLRLDTFWSLDKWWFEVELRFVLSHFVASCFEVEFRIGESKCRNTFVVKRKKNVEIRL